MPRRRGALIVVALTLPVPASAVALVTSEQRRASELAACLRSDSTWPVRRAASRVHNSTPHRSPGAASRRLLSAAPAALRFRCASCRATTPTPAEIPARSLAESTWTPQD